VPGSAALGCGGGDAQPAIVAPPPPPKPRNAADIAWDIVHAQVGAMIYVDRIRGRPLAAKIQSLELLHQYLDGTGITLETDVERAFFASPATNRGSESVTVVEHRLANSRLKEDLDLMLSTHRLEGAWLEPAGSIPMARVTARGQTRIMALIDPNFLVFVPEAHAAEVGRFVGTGGFPDPTGPEAVVSRAIDPSRTVRGNRLPPIPATISSGVGSITLTDDGGADIALDGQSQSPEQAVADAAEVTRTVEEATTVKVAIIRLRVFKPVEFYAEGDHVKTKVHMTSGEIDSLFGALSAMMPRQ
jgi:hypothetical protein